jgi:coenzyme F420 hydrogenase subunit delta
MHNMHNAIGSQNSSSPLSRYEAPVLIFGCGNTLMGDDGFGPAVIECLQTRHTLPSSVWVEDVGTSIRDILFDLLLAPQKPQMILIIDAARQDGRPPGELFELPVDGIAAEKVNDFSVHHFPSLNLLKELSATAGVEVRVLTVQVKCLPEEIQAGLSPEVAAAIPLACDWALRLIFQKINLLKPSPQLFFPKKRRESKGNLPGTEQVTSGTGAGS